MIKRHLKSVCLFRMTDEVNASNDIKSDSPLTGTISGGINTVLPGSADKRRATFMNV
jgi:hypothetical protein